MKKILLSFIALALTVGYAYSQLTAGTDYIILTAASTDAKVVAPPSDWRDVIERVNSDENNAVYVSENLVQKTLEFKAENGNPDWFPYHGVVWFKEHQDLSQHTLLVAKVKLPIVDTSDDYNDTTNFGVQLFGHAEAGGTADTLGTNSDAKEGANTRSAFKYTEEKWMNWSYEIKNWHSTYAHAGTVGLVDSTKIIGATIFHWFNKGSDSVNYTISVKWIAAAKVGTDLAELETSIESTLGIATAIDEPVAELFTVHPNPTTSGVITVKSDKVLGDVSFFNIVGQNVLNMRIDTKEATIPVSGLQKGMYFIKVNGYTQRVSIK